MYAALFGGLYRRAGGIGIFEMPIRKIHSFVVKSPQFRLILAKRGDQDRGRSQEIVNYRSLLLRSRIIRVFQRK